MADFQQNFLASLGAGYNFGQQIKQQQDTSKLNQLASLAYSAPQEQRQGLLSQMAGVSPQAAQAQQKAWDGDEERRNKSMVNMARMLTSAPEQYRPALYANMRPTLAQFGLSELPESYDQQSGPIIDQAAQSLVQAYQGRGQGSNQNKVVGGALVSPTGEVIYESPADTKIVELSVEGGKQQFIYNPRTQGLSPLGSAMRQMQTGGQDYRVGGDLTPEQLALAQADMANSGGADSYNLGERNVSPQQFGRSGGLGFTPNKPDSAPSGYNWDASGSSLVPIPGGPADRKANPTPADQATGEMGMRKEIAARLKDDRSVLSMYQNVQNAATNTSAAGDLSLIFAFMKMLDPGSVVREQEFANAQNAAGVPDQIRNAYNKAVSGQRLNPNQRADFMGQARLLASSAQDRISNVTREYQGMADGYGYDPTRATGMADFRDVRGASSSSTAQQAARPQSEQDFNALPQGALYIDPDDGRTYRKR